MKYFSRNEHNRLLTPTHIWNFHPSIVQKKDISDMCAGGEKNIPL